MAHLVQVVEDYFLITLSFLGGYRTSDINAGPSHEVHGRPNATTDTRVALCNEILDILESFQTEFSALNNLFTGELRRAYNLDDDADDVLGSRNSQLDSSEISWDARIARKFLAREALERLQDQSDAITALELERTFNGTNTTGGDPFQKSLSRTENLQYCLRALDDLDRASYSRSHLVDLYLAAMEGAAHRDASDDGNYDQYEEEDTILGDSTRISDLGEATTSDTQDIENVQFVRETVFPGVGVVPFLSSLVDHEVGTADDGVPLPFNRDEEELNQSNFETPHEDLRTIDVEEIVSSELPIDEDSTSTHDNVYREDTVDDQPADDVDLVFTLGRNYFGDDDSQSSPNHELEDLVLTLGQTYFDETPFEIDEHQEGREAQPTSHEAEVVLPTVSECSEPSPPANLCSVCQEEIMGRDIQLQCDHHYDVSCLLDMFLQDIKDETVFPPRCCGERIPLLLVEQHFSQSVLEELNEKIREFSTPNRLYCSNTLCSRFLGPTEKTPDRKICRCGTQTCAACLTSHPLDTFCRVADAEDVRQVLLLGQSEGWQRCPGCRQLIERFYGCNHITCRCARQFCYICAALWKTCTCPQFEEETLLGTGRREAVGDYLIEEERRNGILT